MVAIELKGGSAMAGYHFYPDGSADPEGDDILEELSTDKNLDRILREIGEGKRLTGILRG